MNIGVMVPLGATVVTGATLVVVGIVLAVGWTKTVPVAYFVSLDVALIVVTPVRAHPPLPRGKGCVSVIKEAEC